VVAPLSRIRSARLCVRVYHCGTIPLAECVRLSEHHLVLKPRSDDEEAYKRRCRSSRRPEPRSFVRSHPFGRSEPGFQVAQFAWPTAFGGYQMSRALVVDMYMFPRVWFLHWGSHGYQMKWNPRHAHFVPGFSIHGDGLHRPDTKPVSVAHSGLVSSRRCIAVRSSTVTVVLHGSDYWLLNEDFIVWKAWRFFWLAVG
jgi:hypothetical protein